MIDEVPQNVYPVKSLGSANEMSFDYESDFDENGLLYFLGTHGHTRPWVNPGISGIVAVSASSLGSDAERITSFVGRETVRCYTKSEKHSDMTVDLKNVRMNVTKYTLRHYISSDTEALRHWNLEGSVDEANWVILKSHIGDTSLNKMGATKTWDVSHQGWFQYFRIITTGPNSNDHDYLCCSGIELYGNAVGGFVSHPPSEKVEEEEFRETKEFVYNGTDFSNDGLLYYLGTMGQTQPWMNPHTLGQVSCSASALNVTSEPIHNLCGRTALRLVSNEAAGSWMQINLLQHRIKLTAYTLRHYSSFDTEALRSWKLEGSHEGKSWVTVMNHENDTALQAKGQAYTWMVDDCDEYYKLFRISLTGKNSNDHNYLSCSGLELFGTAKGNIFSKKVSSPLLSKSVSNVPIGTICYCRQPLSKVHHGSSNFSNIRCSSCCAFLLGNVNFYCKNKECLYRRIKGDIFIICATCYSKDGSIYLNDMRTETYELIAAKVRVFLHATSSVSFFSILGMP